MPLKRREFSALAGALLLGSGARAQTAGRPIRLVVGFTPGGGVDVVARLVADHMGRQLGQPIIVDNKPGGGGVIAADHVAKGPADGSLLVMGTANSMTGPPLLQPSQVPYDPFKDFTPVTQMGLFSLVLVIPPQLPVNNLAEFVAYARERPGKLNYASSNPTVRLAAIQLFAQHKLDLMHVPYKGEAPGAADIMANRVHALFGTVAGSGPLVKDGRLKALLVQRDTRSPGLPEVPTARELGANIQISPWSGLFGPANLPAAIAERYSQAYRTAVALPEVRQRMDQLGFEPVPTSPQEMGAIHRREYDILRMAIQEQGIKFD